MKTVLSISSQTVAGVVGNRVTQFVLQRMGHRVWAIPTALNSNHGGHALTHSEPVTSQAIEALIGNLEANGWLSACDAVFTGYLASVDHVLVVETWVKRLKARNSQLIYFCDPIIGDDAPPGYDPESGGIYVAEEIAEAIRTKLVPLADIISPNRFELAYLSDAPIRSAKDVDVVARSLEVPTLLATGIPDAGGYAVLAVTPQETLTYRHRHLDDVPKGTGDVIAAAYLGAVLSGLPTVEAHGFAASMTFELCRLSQGCDELQLIAAQHLFDFAV